VLALLRGGLDHEAAARELGVGAGLVYMIATGRPADGEPADDQRLVNPRPHNPTRKPHVLAWVAERARRELTPAARS
jgi:hypothetical protein